MTGLTILNFYFRFHCESPYLAGNDLEALSSLWEVIALFPLQFLSAVMLRCV